MNVELHTKIYIILYRKANFTYDIKFCKICLCCLFTVRLLNDISVAVVIRVVSDGRLICETRAGKNVTASHVYLFFLMFNLGAFAYLRKRAVPS